MSNALLIFAREIRDQLRDKRTLFMLIVLPLMLYPALGYGTIQATILFQDQPRNVVVLGVGDLPSTSLLVPVEDSPSPSGVQFDPRYFSNPEDATRLIVTTDGSLPGVEPPLTDDTIREVIASPDADLATVEAATKLLVARSVAGRVEELDTLKSEIGELAGRAERARSGDAAAEPLTPAEQTRLDELTLAADALAQQVSQGLAAADIQVLLIIPENFAADLATFNAEVVKTREADADDTPLKRPQPRLVQNTADDKSRAAVGRVQDAIRSWERVLLTQRLAEANLSTELVEPVSAQPLDLARSEDRASNVWSRLFPFLLVLMSVTGAFYPAIDLGAGEKERGTMETLLICPATRGQIVAGKFFTVFSFSLITTVLNIVSMGVTGGILADQAMGGAGGLELPPWSALAWVFLFALPMAAMFSALSLALAMFARSSKEGQYYLTPLITVTIGLAMFAASPLVDMAPFYAVMPVVGPALLLKALLSPGTVEGLVWYLPVVLAFSTLYSVLALWWAKYQFNSEDILFREAEQFELGLWLRQLVTERGPTPSIAEAGVCFFILMSLNLAGQTVLRPLFSNDVAQSLMTVAVMQQTLLIALPAVLMGAFLTADIRRTFLLFGPKWKYLAAAVVLPLVLHPLTVELGGFLSEHFFLPLPESFVKGLEAMTDSSVPLAASLGVLALTPAICEELAFRGFLLTGLSSKKQVWGGILVSSLCFGLIHMIPQQIFNATLLGIVIALIAVRSGSLLPGVVFHLLYNGLQVVRARLGEETIVGLDGSVAVFQDGAIRYGWGTLCGCGAIAAGVLIWLVRQPLHERFALTPPVKDQPLATTFRPAAVTNQPDEAELALQR